eukprot:6878605-Prymnesium_polylepis.2
MLTQSTPIACRHVARRPQGAGEYDRQAGGAKADHDDQHAQRESARVAVLHRGAAAAAAAAARERPQRGRSRRRALLQGAAREAKARVDRRADAHARAAAHGHRRARVRCAWRVRRRALPARVRRRSR